MDVREFAFKDVLIVDAVRGLAHREYKINTWNIKRDEFKLADDEVFRNLKNKRVLEACPPCWSNGAVVGEYGSRNRQLYE